MNEEGDVPREIIEHYQEDFDESDRLLTGGRGQVELFRTKELIGRFLPPAPAKIIDIGGGPGVYAEWLSDLGYEVYLIDPVPKHVEQAHARVPSLMACEIGDARSLAFADDSFDMALLAGPLYHLIERDDRLRAIREACRVTKTGNVVIAAAINRFASTIDLLHGGIIDDPAFRAIAERDRIDGVHLNTTDDPRLFTTAFLHHPTELESELSEAGLTGVELFAVEGIAWAAPDLDERIADPEKRRVLLQLLESLEQEETLLGASVHLLAVGRTADV